MSGRHTNAKRRRARSHRKFVLLGVFFLAALVAAALAIVYLRPVAKTQVTASRTPSTCTAGMSLTVAADPSVVSVVGDIATRWAATKPVIDGACPTVTVRSKSSASAASSFARPDTALPDVWIPNSKLWVDKLRSATAGIDASANSIWLYPPIATSPLVIATTPGHASAVRRLVKQGWGGIFTASSPLATDDPARNTDGLVTVLTAAALLNKSAGRPSRTLVNSFVSMSRESVPNAVDGLTALAANPGSAPPVAVSEQDVLRFADTGGSGEPPKVIGVYPRGPAIGFDWPVAQFTPPGGDPARRDVAAAFIAQLATPDAQRRLRAIGLRDRDGIAPEGAPATRRLPAPGVDPISDTLRAWTAAGATTRTLLVIDLSGSMAESAGGGQTKIEFAAAAEQAAIDFLPDSSAVGLWGFSVDRTRSTDWKQLVTLGPLGAKIRSTTRRSVMTAVGTTLPKITKGATGLYSTALAAYRAVRNGFDPTSVNSVVLLTDGANTDRRGIRLPALLTTLREYKDAERPIPLNTIAVGNGADVKTLRQISAATGGTEYTVAKPADIRDVFLDAVIGRA